MFQDKGKRKPSLRMFYSAEVLSAVLIGLFLVSGFLASPISLKEGRSYAQSSGSQSWHQGTNQSTPQVDVNYTEMYTSGPNINSNQTLDRLDADMGLGYNDGTGEAVLFGISYSFAPGGMDLADHEVLNWSKVIDAGLTLQTAAMVNDTSLGTMYVFNGFDIVNGSANDFSLAYNNLGHGNYTYSVNNVIGSINYANATSISIGAVSLSTANTVYNGKTLNESIARFNVTIDALMSNVPLPPISSTLENASSTVSVPVVLMFQVTHDVVQTNIKYGVSVDWSANKAFPTGIVNADNGTFVSNVLKTGDNFSLVAADRLSFAYGRAAGANTSYTQATTFTTDPENDSAIYLVNGTQLCREVFPLNYTIDGSTQVINTSRVYVPVSFQSTWNQSSMFVVYGGFKYNVSSGFTFDPAVITPNSVSASNNNPGPSNLHSSTTGSSSNNPTRSEGSLYLIIPAAVVIAIAAGAVLVIRRKSVAKS
jgi:hypothetical protein